MSYGTTMVLTVLVSKATSNYYRTVYQGKLEEGPKLSLHFMRDSWREDFGALLLDLQ